MTDEELYQQVRVGNVRAFDLLYDRHQKHLYHYIYRYLSNKEIAQEIFHEVLLQVLKGRELDFSKGTFKGWLYLVARNSCLNHLRTMKREALAQSNLLIESENRLATQMTTEQVMINNEFTSQVHSAINKLPQPLKELLNLKLSGLDYKEISQTLKIPVGTIKSRVHTLVQFIKTEMDL